LNETILYLGYGSLLSGYGLLAERRGGRNRLIAIDAEPAVVLNAQRGLGKPSSHGSYLAMDLEPRDRTAPITARAGLAASAPGSFGALLLTYDRASAPLIAQREEYDPAHFLRLIDCADRAGKPLGQFLMDFALNANFDFLEYRRSLWRLLGYTSPGYVFHPVPIEDGRIAIVAIRSGYEGSGGPSVVSRRRGCGIDRLYPLGSALKISSLPIDREGQIGYFAECILGGIHGLAVADLLGELDLEASWSRDLALRLSESAGHETERFIR